MALPLLADIEQAQPSSAVAQQKLGELYTICSRHSDAARCFAKALELAPNDAACQFNVATSLIADGKINDAQNALDRLIAHHPQDYIAYYTRAGLKRQTSASNHIDELLALLARGIRDPNGEMYICYALAKEFEDLGEYNRSFQYLKQGADNRRRRLAYRVED
ncbi:MAG: tetratricopeptide repeat protein, partial [Alphaproteobacteria bacterium]|nr:tetratricopeptide repeat protein [Alphaproteobacteria bacterium]